MANKGSIYMEGKNNIGILLCHSLGADPDQMKPFAKKLNKLGYTISIPLYDGHGGKYADVIASEVPKWYQNVVDAYTELKQTVSRVVVIGMSIGGTFTVKLAQEFPIDAAITVNAPVLGFDLYNDLFTFISQTTDKSLLERYKEHRMNYFRFIVPVGQIEALKQITTPLFVLQGSKDADRYKTSSMMLMTYVSSTVKQRKDYKSSGHLLLVDNDKKEAMDDIITFIQENVKEVE